MNTWIYRIFAIVILVSSGFGAVLNVPEQYATIQSAIDAASDYDEVVIAAGTYSGTGNRNLNFRGKKIILRGSAPADWSVVNETIIDCGGSSRAMSFYMAETEETIVEGITITNGYSTMGGAVYCYNNSSPIIRNCIFINNRGLLGGAIACANTNTAILITNCIITNNTALVSGGGIYSNGASPTIKNCIIAENSASEGGGIYLHYPPNMTVLNCTISENYASTSGGAIYCNGEAEIIVKNSIVWGNTAADNVQIKIGSSNNSATAKISYCNIENPDSSILCMSNCTLDYGPGNIETDPLFINPAESDYHIQETSPCINAGDPTYTSSSNETDIDGEKRIAGSGVDIGADEIPALSIEAEIKIAPQTISLKSSGNYINCIIKLPEGYNISDIDPASLRLNNELIPVFTKVDTETQKFTAKFDRADVIETLEPDGNSVVITISGILTDGTSFTGTNTVKLIEFEPKAFKNWNKAYGRMFWCRKSHSMKSKAYINYYVRKNSNIYSCPREKWRKTWNIKFKTNKCATERR